MAIRVPLVFPRHVGGQAITRKRSRTESDLVITNLPEDDCHTLAIKGGRLDRATAPVSKYGLA